MASEKATIQAELIGGSAVAAEAQKIEGSLNKVGAAGGKLGGAMRTVGGALTDIISGGLKAAGVFQTISLAKAVEDVKQLDLATAKLGQSAGVSGTILRGSFDAAEKKTLTGAVAMADLARQLGKVTYDGGFAAGSIATLGEEALAVGRDLGDELPLAVALRDLGITAEKLPAELGRVRDIAEQVSTVGGHVAFKDTLAALSPLLSGVATDSDEARTRLEALIAVLGKGLKPEQAKQAGAAALQQIRSRALDIERATGRRVIDDKGQLIDPTQSLADLKRLADRRFGKNTEAKRRALMSDFGQELGLAIMRTDLGEVDRVAASARDKGKTGAEAERFRQSKEGKRIEAGLAKDQALRGVGDKLVGVHDTLVSNLGVTGALGAELVGGQVALAGAKYAGGKLLAGGVTAAGLGTAAAVAGGAALMAGQVGAVASLGEDRDVMGAKWRSKQANTIGAELAQQAIAAGDVTAVWGKAKGEEQQTAMMEVLLALRETLTSGSLVKAQAEAYAEAIHRRPLKTLAMPDPNAPKGN